MRKLLLHLTCWPTQGCGSARASMMAILSVALLFCPLFISSRLPAQAGDGFSLSADVDGAAGDQGVTAVDVSPEATVSIQIFGKDIQEAQGVSIRFVYDAGQVVYEGADAGDVLPNAQVLPEEGTNPTSVTLGIASLGRPGHGSDGSCGHDPFPHVGHVYGHDGPDGGSDAGQRRAAGNRGAECQY